MKENLSLSLSLCVFSLLFLLGLLWLYLFFEHRRKPKYKWPTSAMLTSFFLLQIIECIQVFQQVLVWVRGPILVFHIDQECDGS